jgi:integrase
MSVRKRVHRYKSGKITKRWNIDVKYTASDGTTHRIREVAKEQTRVGAERQEREIRNALEKPDTRSETQKKPLTLAEFWPIFFKTHVLINNKPSEASSKEKIMKNHLLPRFGSKLMTDITVLAVEEFKVSLIALNYQNKTVNNCLTVLRTALNTAVAWDYLAKSPPIKLLRLPPQDFKFLTFVEARELVELCAPQWRDMVIFALNTGLRVGELLALRWVNVDLTNSTMRVRYSDWQGTIGTPKSGKVRDVPLNTLALQALRERSNLDSLVFCHNDGQPHTYRQANYALEKACRGTKLQGTQWHTLRHTFASHLAMKGVSLRAIQELLGHSTQIMTEKYAHLSPHVIKDAVMTLTPNPDFTKENFSDCFPVSYRKLISSRSLLVNRADFLQDGGGFAAVFFSGSDNSRSLFDSLFPILF